MKKFISIDPGVSGTGLTFWDGGEFPKFVMSMRGKTIGAYMEKIGDVFAKTEPDLVVIEEASYFQGDVRGEVTAKSGKLIKLAMYIGALEELCRFWEIPSELVTPMKWKGQIGKKIIEDRIKRIWPDWDKHKITTDHAWDSVGIGFWKIGKI